MKYILAFCMMAFGTQGWAADAAPVENFTAKIFTAKGNVEYLKKDTAVWVAVQAPFMLEVGDQVKTGPKSKAEIYIKYGAKVRLGEETTFVVSAVAPEGNVVEVARGKMQAWIRKFIGRGFTVRTPSAVCAVRGTVFGVEVSEAGQTTWDLFSGSIQIADNRNRTIDVQPNQRVQVTQAEGAAEPVALPAGVKAPSEPSKIKEEKEEIKAEKPIMDAKAKEEAAAAAAAKAAAEKAEAEKKAAEEAAAAAAAPVEEAVVEEPVAPVIVEPVTTVIPTEVVQESGEVSASNP
ncbi:MAG: FecR family protein [Elusimicrobiales bacterium]|nr:FecR family protein [Elusimicrobiales bacterium]